MGNRLTLPLLLLAALLAGGAFFWMTGGERRGAAADHAAPARPVDEARAPAELSAPEIASSDPKAGVAPARVELPEAHEPAAAPKKKKQGEVSVSGRVLDRFGAAVAGARVITAADTGFPVDLELERQFPWLRRQRVETDADGRFHLDGVQPGSMQIAVRAPGFAPFDQRGLSVPAADTELDPFVVARGAILSGIVVDPDARPVAGARVVRAPLEGGGFFLAGEREAAAVTGADGRFRVDELACGAWRFLVRSDEHPDLTVEGVAEEPGVEQGGLRWQLAPGATIAGTVTGIPSAERGQLDVRASRAGQDGFFAFGSGRSAHIEPNGSFLLRGLDVGEGYTLQARRAQTEDDFGFFERSRSESVRARSGDAGVVLAYQPEAALTFTVYDAATRAPLEEFSVESGIDWPAPLRDDDGRERKLFPGGAVRVGGLRPNSDQQRVQLVVKATGYSDYQRADIAVRAGQELDLGPIYLDPVPVVRVHVLDAKSGAPIADATVRLQKQQPGDAMQFRRQISISADEGVDSIEIGEGRTAKTDDKGWAVLTSYEGERGELSARAKGYAPAKLSDLELPRGKTIEQELRLTQGGEVLVRVLDAQGAPLAGARVEHRAPGAGERGPGGMRILGASPQGEVTDAAGEVVFENLAVGVHDFRLADASGGGGAVFGGAGADTMVIAGMGGDAGDEWSQAQVNEGERGELVLRAAPRATLSGRVREAGKVLAGATLHLAKAGTDDAPRFKMPGMSDGPEAKSDGEGRYLIDDVKEGSYTLTVEHATRRMPQEFTLELREGENSFDVDLPLSIVTGKIADRAGKGLAGVRVWSERHASEESGRRPRAVMLMIGDDGGSMMDTGQFGERALTDADGNYTLRGVASDADLVIKAEGDSVQPGESPVLRVAPNETKQHVDLALDPAGSIRVEANLADGSPARFQLVRAEYLGDDPKPEDKFGFLQQGSTELKGLKPGHWKVNVRNANTGPRGEGGQDQEIEVQPGATAKATFEVE